MGNMPATDRQTRLQAAFDAADQRAAKLSPPLPLQPRNPYATAYGRRPCGNPRPRAQAYFPVDQYCTCGHLLGLHMGPFKAVTP
jgi:hypothetical protein